MIPLLFIQLAFSSQVPDRILDRISKNIITMIDMEDFTVTARENTSALYSFRKGRGSIVFDKNFFNDAGRNLTMSFNAFELQDHFLFTFENATIKKIYDFIIKDSKNESKIILYSLVYENIEDRLMYHKYTFIDREKCRTGLISRLNHFSRKVKGPKFIFLGEIKDGESYNKVKRYNLISWNSYCKPVEYCNDKIFINLTVDDHIFYLFKVDILNFDSSSIFNECLAKYYGVDFQAIWKFMTHFDIEKLRNCILLHTFRNLSEKYCQNNAKSRLIRVIMENTALKFLNIKMSHKINSIKSVNEQQLEKILIVMHSLLDYELVVKVVKDIFINQESPFKLLFLKLLTCEYTILEDEEVTWLKMDINSGDEEKLHSIISKMCKHVNKNIYINNINFFVYLHFEIQDYLEKCKEKNYDCEILNDFENLQDKASISLLKDQVFFKAYEIVNNALSIYPKNIDRRDIIQKYIIENCGPILSNSGKSKADERKLEEYLKKMKTDYEVVESLFSKLEEFNEKIKEELVLDYQEEESESEQSTFGKIVSSVLNIFN